MKKKVVVSVLIICLIAVIICAMYLIDRNRMKNNKPVLFSNWGYSYAPPVMVKEYNYSKTIANTVIELDIPSEWKFEEDIASDEYNNFYKFALKIYKDSSDKNITLYLYNGPFGVCGTGRTSKDIKLNNGKDAIVGYYDNNEEWWDISFYEINPNIAFLNCGLEGNDANEALEIAKTINISNVNEERKSNRTPENVSIEILKDTITNRTVESIITDNNEDYYGWGVDFKIQKKVNEKWEDLKYISADIAWIEIAYVPNEDNQIKQKLNIENYYGELKKGIYRVAKTIYDKEYIEVYSNEFTIK